MRRVVDDNSARRTPYVWATEHVLFLLVAIASSARFSRRSERMPVSVGCDRKSGRYARRRMNSLWSSGRHR